MSRAVLVPPDFDPVPSASRAVLLEIAGPADADGASGPEGTGALGVLVAETGEPPERLGLDRAALARSGFDGKQGRRCRCRNRTGGSASPSATVTPDH